MNRQTTYEFPNSTRADLGDGRQAREALLTERSHQPEQIVKERQQIHKQYGELRDRYEHADAAQRDAIREQMKPLLERDRELHAALNPGQSQDMGYGR